MFNPEALRRIIEGGGVPFRSGGVSFIFTCPRCNKAQKLYIRRSDGRFTCWVCSETSGFRGKPEYALRELYGIPMESLRKQLYGEDTPETLLYQLPIPEFKDFWGEDDDAFEVEIEPKLPKGVAWLPDHVGPTEPAFAAAARYLAARGMTIDHVNKYQIKYDPAANRLIFPFIVEGRLLGWQGRFIGDLVRVRPDGQEYKIPKALTTLPQGVSGRYLMFQDRLKGSAHCVLAEGPTDAIKADLCGGNVAGLGKGVTSEQIRTISKYGIRKLYLGLDPDAGPDISRIVDLHGEDFDEVRLLLPPKGFKDLGECSPEIVYEQFMRAPLIRRGALMVSLGDQLIY